MDTTTTDSTPDVGDGAVELEQVEEREYTGRIGGFLSDKCIIYLHLYDSGVLDGHVRQRKKKPLNGLVLLSTSKKKLKTRSREGETSQVHQEEEGGRESAITAFIHGSWIRSAGRPLTCEFQATRRDGHVDRHTLSCTVKLFKNGSASGKLKTVGMEVPRTKQKLSTKNMDTFTIENVFEWRRVQVSGAANVEETTPVSKDSLALYPLTPGTYHFRGFTTYHVPEQPQAPHQPGGRGRKRKRESAPPPREDCLVTMELRPDGSLKGTSREVMYPQSCVITGSWELGRVRYILEYRVREAVGRFKYSGRVAVVGDAEDEEEDGSRQVDETAVRVLKGKWRNVDDDGESTPGYAGGRGNFELTCVLAQRASMIKSDATDSQVIEIEETKESYDEENVIFVGLTKVFTTGSYVLHGKAIDDEGYEYASELRLELLADGSLHGTCQELVFHQVQTLHGNWTKHTIEYEVQYAVKKDVGRYWYKGKLDDDGVIVRGTWCNMELLMEGGDDPNASYRGENGNFSYAITDVQRRWSHRSHNDFPKAFRDRIWCILLCSQRTHVLPSALWTRIFAFCGHDWFQAVTAVMKAEQVEDLPVYTPPITRSSIAR